VLLRGAQRRSPDGLLSQQRTRLSSGQRNGTTSQIGDQALVAFDRGG
jgi:hypothetical protein